MDRLNPILYTQVLLASFGNVTATYLAGILACSHDVVSDFLRSHPLKPRALWNRVKKLIPLERRRRGVMVLDDTVLDKGYSEKIESATRQWSGNAHKVITGMGVVHWLHDDPVEGDYLPIDFRIWDVARDAKSKHDHAREMFRRRWNATSPRLGSVRRLVCIRWSAQADPSGRPALLLSDQIQPPSLRPRTTGRLSTSGHSRMDGGNGDDRATALAEGVRL
ncbi:hypothetical protein FJZ36_13090, partial [Candidatus Poribacteria bacterium]|nr:hypothetical protein [Candidatus Poribacteria bacterium]